MGERKWGVSGKKGPRGETISRWGKPTYLEAAQRTIEKGGTFQGDVKRRNFVGGKRGEGFRTVRQKFHGPLLVNYRERLLGHSYGRRKGIQKGCFPSEEST